MFLQNQRRILTVEQNGFLSIDLPVGQNGFLSIDLTVEQYGEPLGQIELCGGNLETINGTTL